MTFAHSWILVAPLLFIIFKLLLRRKPNNPIPYFSGPLLANIRPSLRLQMSGPVITLFELLTVVCLSVAAAQPQKILKNDEEQSARNIMLVVDTSNSMSGRDFPTTLGQTSRMEGVKSVVAEYVRTRTNDRVGLIVFGNSAYLQSPLTTDTSLVEKLVRELQPRIAGDGTAIGDGLGLALKRLRDVKSDSRAIILMTDGVNTAGQVSPMKAASVAKALNIKIHTIGIGSGKVDLNGGGVVGLLSGRRPTVVDFDEKTLREISQITGGVYFNAQSLKEFQTVYKEIQSLQEEERQQPSKPIVQELFVTWSLASLVALCALVMSQFIFFREVP